MSKKFYKKTNISFNNPYGLNEIDKINFDKPLFIFCAAGGGFGSAQQRANGYLNTILYLLRVRHKNNIRSGLSVDELPFNIYGETSESFFDNRFYIQLENIIKENHNVNYLIQIFKKINFISYCAGNENLLDTINYIHDLLANENFSEQDINNMMSQISVLQIVDNLKKYDNGQTVKDENGNFLIGETFPYVTTNTIHISQDNSNKSYLDHKFRNNSNFSKVDIIHEAKNRNIILYESFGENALTTDREHVFDIDYINRPVINAIMSIILIKSYERFEKNDRIDINYWDEPINMILSEARKYEENSNKKLDDFDNEDLENFSNYMMNIINNYIFNNFKIEKKSDEILKNEIFEDKIISDNAADLDFSLNKYLNRLDNVYLILETNIASKDNKEDIIVINGTKNISVEDFININIIDIKKNVIAALELLDELDKKFEANEHLNNQYNDFYQNYLEKIREKVSIIQNFINKFGLETEGLNFNI